MKESEMFRMDKILKKAQKKYDKENLEMKDELLLKKANERLDDVYFWLAVLRNFDQFTETERAKIDEAYTSISEIYEEGSPRLRFI